MESLENEIIRALTEDEQNECSICLEPMLPESWEGLTFFGRCEHLFHIKCLEERWANIRLMFFQSLANAVQGGDNPTHGINYYNVCPLCRREPSGHLQREREEDRPLRGGPSINGDL